MLIMTMQLWDGVRHLQTANLQTADLQTCRHKMNGKNENGVSRVALLPSLKSLALKSEVLLEFEFF